MFSFLDFKNSERMKYAKEIANSLSSNCKITSSYRSALFEVKIPSSAFGSKEHFLSKARSFCLDHGFSIKNVRTGIECRKDKVFINFIYPPENAHHNKDLCYVDIIWIDEYRELVILKGIESPYSF